MTPVWSVLSWAGADQAEAVVGHDVIACRIVTEDIDLRERRSRRQHREQLGIKASLGKLKREVIESDLAGACSARLAADVESLCVTQQELAQRKKTDCRSG